MTEPKWVIRAYARSPRGKFIDHPAGDWEEALERAVRYNRKFQEKIFYVTKAVPHARYR